MSPRTRRTRNPECESRMDGILIAVFESRSDADAARAALLEQGFHDGQIGIEGGDAHADDEAHGLAGVITRMFSGFATPPDAPGRDYADIVAHGGCLLALYGADDAAMARASAVLLAHGARDVRPRGNASPEPQASPDPRVERELAAVSTVGGPQVYVLPNAPVDWRHTGSRTSDLRTTDDPAQPRGELSGTDDIAPQADREMLDRRKARR